MKYLLISISLIFMGCFFKKPVNIENSVHIDNIKYNFIDSLLKTKAIKKIEPTKFTKSIFEDKKLSNLLTISPSDFGKIYQIDSLLSKYNPENDYGYYFGTIQNNYFNNLVIIRAYGEWIKSLEYLTYDKDGKLKGILDLSGIGGETDDYYECYGSFINDSIYHQVVISNREDLSESEGFDEHDKFDTIQHYYLIKKTGIIVMQ